MLLISGINLLYVYCEPGATKWKDLTVEDDKWITYENERIEWRQVFGGYVDTDINIQKIYLFGGQFTSSNGIIRKFLYDCDYEYIGEVSDDDDYYYCGLFLILYNRKGWPKNISLDCKRKVIGEACTPRMEEPIDWLMMALIIASVTFIVLLAIQLLICYRKKEKVMVVAKDDKPSLQMNRERVIGNTKPLAQFAGKYERKENTKGLARKRTLI